MPKGNAALVTGEGLATQSLKKITLRNDTQSSGNGRVWLMRGVQVFMNKIINEDFAV